MEIRTLELGKTNANQITMAIRRDEYGVKGVAKSPRYYPELEEVFNQRRSPNYGCETSTRLLSYGCLRRTGGYLVIRPQLQMWRSYLIRKFSALLEDPQRTQRNFAGE